MITLFLIFQLFLKQTSAIHPVQLSRIHLTAPLNRVQAGRWRVSRNQTNPLTYEELYPPSEIYVRKNFNSFNTSFLKGGLRCAETLVEDFFIRRFIEGTWHRLFQSNVIIKRRANAILIAGVVNRSIGPTKIYFLTGFSEEILSHLLKCPVKMELETASRRDSLVVKYV